MNNIMSIILLFSLSVITISANPIGIDVANPDLHQAVDKLDLNKDGFVNPEESGDQSAGGRSRRQVTRECTGEICEVCEWVTYDGGYSEQQCQLEYAK